MASIQGITTNVAGDVEHLVALATSNSTPLSSLVAALDIVKGEPPPGTVRGAIILALRGSQGSALVEWAEHMHGKRDGERQLQELVTKLEEGTAQGVTLANWGAVNSQFSKVKSLLSRSGCGDESLRDQVDSLGNNLDESLCREMQAHTGRKLSEVLLALRTDGAVVDPVLEDDCCDRAVALAMSPASQVSVSVCLRVSDSLRLEV